jgi:hypothetical protein
VNAFIQELGQRLADRWLTYILIPGLLFAGAVLAASALGDARALDAGTLVTVLTSRVSAVQHRGDAGLAVVLAVLALGSSGAALAARLLGSGLQRLWLSQGRWPLRRLTARRLRRWEAVAVGCGLACVLRAREAAATLADLIEAAVDLNAPALAVATHLTTADERLAPARGRELTRLFRKGALSRTAGAHCPGQASRFAAGGGGRDRRRTNRATRCILAVGRGDERG